MGESTPADGATVVIVNPAGGRGDHESMIRDRSDQLGLTVRATERAGHAVELAEEAIRSGAEELIAAGGDGTVNEVVQAIVAADALDDVGFGVVPAGTGNSFARNVGIPDVETAFDVLQHGERRRIDLGMANGAPFVNSCIAGLTAEASDRTSSALKARMGVFAYVVTTIRMWSEFQGVGLRAEVWDGGTSATAWTGSAGLVLIGNARRFSMTGREQAAVEDGRFDVTIIEDPASLDLGGDHPLERLGDLWPDLIRLQTPTLALSVDDDTPAQFSLDGEMQAFSTVELRTLPRTLQVAVGDAYNPAGNE